MKPSRTCLAAPTLALFGTLLFAGCYTQFTLADRDPADAPDAQPVYADQPPVLIIDYVPQPLIIDPSPSYLPAPVVTGPVTGPGGAATSPKRDSGNQRTPPPPAPAGSISARR